MFKVFVTGRDPEWLARIEEILKQTADWQSKSIHIIAPGIEATSKKLKDCIRYHIRQSNILLTDLKDIDCQTAQEIQYALDHNIPCIGFGVDVDPCAASDCQVFSTVYEAVDYIRDCYLSFNG